MILSNYGTEAFRLKSKLLDNISMSPLKGKHNSLSASSKAIKNGGSFSGTIK
jgi:hypothetical protein